MGREKAPSPPTIGLTWKRCTNSARHTFNLQGLIWPPTPGGERTELQTWQPPGLSGEKGSGGRTNRDH